LQILKAQKVKATFFIVGSSAQRYPQLVRQEATAGHLIANHSWDHPEFELLSYQQMKQELDKTANIIKKLVGYRPIFFRPPHGVLTSSVYWTATGLGYKVVLWSDELKERRFKSAYEDARFVSRLAGPGAIVLMHDGLLDHSKGVQALPYLIKFFKARNYKFVRLDELPLPRLKSQREPLIVNL
jgi:peptidoglycan/xylan/chitin deacetylase (PgdA/CDA1 family)